VPADQAADTIARLQSDAKRLARENEQLKMKIALGGGAKGGEDDDTVPSAMRSSSRGGSTGSEKGALRGLSDSLRDRSSAAWSCWRPRATARCSSRLGHERSHRSRESRNARQRARADVGGGGGGRPDFAEAGGKDASKIDALLAKARELVTAALESSAT
jgi:alanyl-tRNA synthetase